MSHETEVLRTESESAKRAVIESVTATESCVSDWREELAAAIAPSLMEQAKRYVVDQPAVAKELGKEGMQRLKGSMMSTASSLTAHIVDQVTVDSVEPSSGSDLRASILRDIASAAAKVLRAHQFNWAGWIGSAPSTTRPQSAFLNDDEVKAFTGVLNSLDQLTADRRTALRAEVALEKAEALDLWDA